MEPAEAQLEAFLAKYLPPVAAIGRSAIRRLRLRFPGCDALVFDNFEALAVGFAPDGKTTTMFLSVALYPRWVSLYFLQAAGLNDPDRLFGDSAAAVRQIRLSRAEDLDAAALRELVLQAEANAVPAVDPLRSGQLVIKSVAVRQQPRRPV